MSSHAPMERSLQVKETCQEEVASVGAGRRDREGFQASVTIFKGELESSLVLQWSKFPLLPCRAHGFHPGWGTKDSHAEG